MNYCYSLITLAFLAISCREHNKADLTHVKKLTNYPSASAIEYLDGQFFLMGDDANYMLVLDSNLNIKDSIRFYSYPERRIPKNIKHDLEAMAAYRDNRGSLIFLFGSGSLPQRNTGRWHYLNTNIEDSMQIEPLYSQIKQSGVKEINIEGACFIPATGLLVLASRGNKNYPENHLIFTPEKFWESEEHYDITITEIRENNNPASFTGVSGLAYASQSDQLILTASTEDTRSAHEDGAIGKSYLWFIKNISGKNKSKIMTPDETIDLESIDSRFKGQKIESACVTGETNDFIYLVLAADNDDGSSSLFEIKIRKQNPEQK